MIDLDQTKSGHWVCRVTDPNTAEPIEIRIRSLEQDGTPSNEPSDELLTVAYNTAGNACFIRDKMISEIHEWVTHPDYLGWIAYYGNIGSIECDQDVVDYLAHNGLLEYLITEKRDILRTNEKPKLVYIEIYQHKNLIDTSNCPNGIHIIGYIIDPWMLQWTVGEGYIDGPYSLDLPKK
jgi:hypothetical protein